MNWKMKHLQKIFVKSCFVNMSRCVLVARLEAGNPTADTIKTCAAPEMERHHFFFCLGHRQGLCGSGWEEPVIEVGGDGARQAGLLSSLQPPVTLHAALPNRLSFSDYPDDPMAGGGFEHISCMSS